MLTGRFRADFYYRLCSDMITTPSLAEQLRDRPEDRHNLVLFIARRIVEEEAEELADEVVAWIDGNLGRGLRVARQLQGAGAVRPERADPSVLPATPACRPDGR